MAEHGDSQATGPSERHRERHGERRSVSVIGLLFSFAFFAVASVGFTGEPWWLLSEATKWVVAGVIALVGVGLLLTALPGRSRKSLN